MLDPDQAAEIERLTLRFLAGRAPLFDRRSSEGRIVDGHGDLLADDIFCLDDGPQILDCLEFDDRPLAGRRRLPGDGPGAAGRTRARGGLPRLVRRLQRRPGSLVVARALRGAYRAFVRAKVACLRAPQGALEAAAEAQCLTQLTLRHLRAGVVRLVLVGGLPGTGKSSLAAALADRLGCTLLASDRIRKELAGIPPEVSAAAPYGHGIYDPAFTAKTYAELLQRAHALLTMGESVVLDATWISQAHRDDAARLAERAHADLVPLRCDAPTWVAAKRIRERGPAHSDADAAIAAIMATKADHWPETATVDTSGAPDAAVARALAEVLAG